MAIDFLEEKSGIDFQPEGDFNIAPGEKPVEQLGTLEGITSVANLPFQWAARNLFGKIEQAPGDKFGLTTKELTPEEADKSFLGFTPEDFNPPPGTEWPNVLKPVASVGKTASGIAQFLTSPHGITEMASALTPAKQITLAKWFMDMGAGALRSIPEAWKAYRNKDWQAMSDALVNAGVMTYGAGKLGGEMFKKPPPPPTPNRGLMIEERSRNTPPKYAIDPLGNVVDISELSEAEQRELFRGPKEFVPREEYVKPAEAVPPIIGEAGGIEPRLTPERLNKILAGLAARTQLIPGIERGTVKEPGAETLGKVSFGAPAEAEAVPSARQTAVEPTPPEEPEAGAVAVEAPKPKPPTAPESETPSASKNKEAAEIHGDVRPQPEAGKQGVPTEESRGGIQPSGSEEAARQVPLKGEQRPLALEHKPQPARSVSESELQQQAVDELPDYEEEFNRAWKTPVDQAEIKDLVRDAITDPGYEPLRSAASWRYSKDPRALNFPKVLEGYLKEVAQWIDSKPYTPGKPVTGGERTLAQTQALSYLRANHPELIHQLELRKLWQNTRDTYQSRWRFSPDDPVKKGEEQAMEKAYALEHLKRMGLTDFGTLTLDDWKSNYREHVWLEKPGLAHWIEKNVFPGKKFGPVAEFEEPEGYKPGSVEEPGTSRLAPFQGMRTSNQLRGLQLKQKLDSAPSRGPSGESGFINTDILNDVVDGGRVLFEKGMDFARWSARMVQQFGDKVVAYLKHAWDQITGTGESDAIKQWNSEIDTTGVQRRNKFSTEIGLKMRTVKDLDAMRDYRVSQEARSKEMMADAMRETDPQKRMDIMNKALVENQKAALAREAIEVATNTGGWVEGEGSLKHKLGERPLDWRRDGKISQWLGENAEKIGTTFERPRGGLRLRPSAAAAAKRGEAGFINISRLIDDLDRMRQGFKTMFNAVENRLQMDQRLDAADNRANIIGQQAGSNVRQGKVTPKQDVAAAAIVAAEFNPRNLPALLRKAVRGGNKEAEDGIRLAMTDWQTIEPIARRGHDLMDYQHAAENARGINTEYHEGYLPGVYDMDLLMGTGRPFVIAGSRGGGIASGFKKGKTYNSPFDAIEDGYTPRSLKLSDLVEHRVRAGQRLINRIDWGDTFRNVTDPTDNRPIITSPVRHARGPGQPGYESVPMGYVPREVIPGVRVAVHENYSKLFDALTGRSVIEDFEIGGVPVGSLALGTGGAIKHGLLLFDTFHASRIMQKQLFLQGKVSYNKGRTLLEYSDHDLNAAVRDGETTREAADWARANRGTANLLVREGLNVGRVQEALYTQAIRNIPGIGKANKWIFEKLTRGAMMEAGVHEFERVQRGNPNWTPEQVARKVSRDLNVFFGNIGRQGIFKSKTMQDLARLTLLAPQWVESVVRSEIGGVKQLTVDPLINRKLQVGTLGAGMARGLAMYLIATQIGNLITTGLWGNGPKPTWENEDKGHKLDMWVPDFTGKTRGYYISPLSIVAETTHDIMRAARTEPDVLSAVGRVLANKAAPMWRAGKVLLQGKDWSGQQVNGVWNKAKHAAIDLLPLPIPASAAVKGGQPGSTQRLMMQSAGIKAEPAGSIRSEVIDRAKSWGMNNPNAKVAREYDRRSKTTYPESEYKPLRESLVKKNPEQIVKSVKDLLAVDDTLAKKEKHMKQILREFQPFTEKDIKPYATRSREMEIPFVNSLDAAGKKAYVQAIREQIKDYQTLTQAMYGRAMNPPIPAKYRALFTQP